MNDNGKRKYDEKKYYYLLVDGNVRYTDLREFKQYLSVIIDVEKGVCHIYMCILSERK